MRIAVVANTSWYLFNFRLNLMRALLDAGHDVVAIGPLDGYEEKLRDAGIRHRAFALHPASVSPLRELGSVWTLFRSLREERAQAVLSYTPKGNIYSAIASAYLGIPIIPNVSGLGRVFIRRSLLTPLVLRSYKLVFQRAQRVFFQNLDDMQTFVGMGLVAQDKAERIPGSGVDVSRFAPPPGGSVCADAITAGSRLERKFVFLLVARMLWDKGIGEFVEAARQIMERRADVEFWLLGFVDVQNPSAIPRDQIEQWEAEGVVRYLSGCDDVLPHLRAADCVVLPSYREGVPRSLLEAAATATPIITTDAPGCRDTVDDGVTGMLCRPKDAGHLREKMLAMMEMSYQDRLAMGRRGREKMIREFDERLVIDRYVEAVEALGARMKSL